MTFQPRNIPTHAGVYTFFRKDKAIYIGKAVNLKKRLSSYFRKNVSAKVWQLRAEATRLEWIETASDTEALIKEADLIKKHIPKYNVLLRDDKNYFYVAITHGGFPKIFITHQPYSYVLKNIRVGHGEPTAVGPFTNGNALKNTLKLLRRIFPYCTCKELHKRPCLNTQIGRCLGFCCDKNKPKNTNHKFQNEYKNNIKNIVAILHGRKQKLVGQLKNEMKSAAGEQDFERAARLRDQIAGLENIFSHRTAVTHIKTPVEWNKVERVLQQLLNTSVRISRIEGYDISNISGTEATGSMVVFINGQPAKSEYRKFKIKNVHQSNDVAMLQEVIRRRLAHHDWQKPDLMVIDGGKPQLNAAKTAFKLSFPNSHFPIPIIVALAKREEELYTGNTKPIRLATLPEAVSRFFKHVRDESHRFAKKYHHKLREKYFKNKN